jgi:hypothetical protein
MKKRWRAVVMSCMPTARNLTAALARFLMTGFVWA